MVLAYNYLYFKSLIYPMPEKSVKVTRILAEDEIIDITITQVPVSSEIPHGVKYSFNYRVKTSEGWRDLIRFDNAHVIKGHNKRDHKHVFENNVLEINFNSPEELMDDLMLVSGDLLG